MGVSLRAHLWAQSWIPLSMSGVTTRREFLTRTSRANPDAPILVWCDEDSPLLWPELMRELAGLDALVPLEGENDLARTLLSADGNAKLDSYFETRPPEDEATRRRVIASFLSNYGEDAELEQEIDLPGWTDDLVEQLTAAYDEDVDRIAGMSGVTVLTP